MTKVATMGTSSCATIALNGFKDDQKELNDKYLADPKSFIKDFKPDGYTPSEFYTYVLYPTDQPLGKSANYPFDLLMKLIDEGPLKTKFTIITINPYQYMLAGGYWPSRFKEWGFEEMDTTRNSTMSGSLNHIFVRNLGRPDD